MRRAAIALAVLVAAVVGVQHAAAVPTCTATAAVNGDWATAATWGAGGVPDADDHVCIGSGRTVTLAGGSPSVKSLQLGGTLTVAAGTLALTSTSDESTLSGTLTGAGSLTLAGPMTWSGGSMTGTGTTAVLPSGTLSLTGYTTLGEGRVLSNAGLFALTTDNRYVSGTGRVQNQASGVIRRAAAGAGTIGLRVPVDNDGLVDSTGGELELTTGGAGSAGSYGGGAGSVGLSGGVHELLAGAQLLGGVELSAGELKIADGSGATATGANAISGGTLSGPGAFTVASGTLTWSNGTMKGPGTTKVLAGATVSNTGYTTLSEGRVLENAGTFALATDNRYISASGAAPRIHNLAGGVVRRTVAGTGAIGLRVPVENDGILDAVAGEIEMTAGGSGSSGDYGGAAGSVGFSGGVHQLADGAQLHGGVELSSGELSVPAGGTLTASGANRMSGGTLSGPGTLTIDGTLTWSSGTMKGPGTTKVPAGSTLSNTGYTTLSEGRLIENAGTLAMATDNRYVSASGAAPRVHNLPAGLIRRTVAGTNPVQLRVPVENDGTIDAPAGPLELSGGGAGTSSGTFGGGAGTVGIESGTWDLAAGAKLLTGTVMGGATVTIPAGTTVPASGATALSGGTLGGAGTLAITGAGSTLTWDQGTMAGSGVTSVAAGAKLQLAASLAVGGTRTLAVAGRIDSAGNHSLFPAANSEPRLHVLATGTLVKSAGDSWSWINVPVRNEGTVESTSGELQLSRGTPEAHTGVFKGASAAKHVTLTGQDHVLAGTARLDDGTEIAGDVRVRDGDTLTISDEVLHSGGALTGDVSVTGTLTWRAGSQRLPGTTTIQPSGRIAIDSATDDNCASTSLRDGRRLINKGTLAVLDGSRLNSFGTPRPEISNQNRIELDSADQSCGGFTGIDGDALLHNTATGTIEKLGGGGNSYLGSTVDNDGLLVASVGELRLESTSAVGQAGTFRATAAGARVAFENGTFVLETGAVVDGEVAVTGADLLVPEGSTLPVPAGQTLTLHSGSIGGAGDLRIAGTLAWQGGEQLGPGTTFIDPGATATLAPAPGDTATGVALREDRSVVNRGTMTADVDMLAVADGASILNAGTLELRGATEVMGTGFNGAFMSLIHNTGTLRKVGTGTVEATAAIDNDGTVEVTGGTLRLPNLLNWSGQAFFGDAGIVGGDYVVRGGTLIVPGAITANAARLTLDGTAAKVVHESGFPVSQVDALAKLRRNASAGELILTGGRSLTTAPAEGPFVNAGVLRLGAGSKLSAPAFRQAAGGVLATTIAGAGSYGSVAATGAAELAGRLDIASAARPAAGTELPILTAGSRTGGFDKVSGSDAGGYGVLYSATGVRLRALAAALQRAQEDAPEAPDADLDAPAPAAGEAPGGQASLRLEEGRLAPRGQWARRGGYLVARQRGATLARRGVTGRRLDLVAATCRRCGAVRVTWAGASRTLSLRSARPGRRTLRVVRAGRERTGTVRIRTASARRVAIDALLVRR